MNTTEHPPGRGRPQFLLLATLFFAPLLLAVLLYFVFPQWQPTHKTNYGELVNPARPLPELQLLDHEGKPRDLSALRGKWSFIYVGGPECTTLCLQKLYQIRQIRTLLNEKRQRVQRVYLAPGLAQLQAAEAELKKEHPDLVFLAPSGQGVDLAGFLGAKEPQALYLVDPHGNWLMVYPAAAESPGILKDIKKLLRLSQIG
ncbi:SCO family protein [Solimonas sp. K1W22B-7]|uniref:SCO family protein n=1 Tax=Solimonas sp. K1W22B-7 TaxID=2303331 RepID=UPI0013C4052C|nr:SCO family protein [Solimonas sp. K1W22B-7]